MEIFTVRWPRVRPFVGLGRNDLLRLSDRVESIATVFAILIAVLAIPVAAAIGTTVHERRSAAHAEYVASIHQTEATAVVDGRPIAAEHYRVIFSTQLRWNAAGRNHSATVDWPQRVRAGDHVMLWVNEFGELTDAPESVDHAARDGIAMAAVLWFTVIGLSAAALQLLRWRLDVVRFARWDRALDALADDGTRQ